MPNGGDGRIFEEDTNVYTYYRVDTSATSAPKQRTRKWREGLFSRLIRLFLVIFRWGKNGLCFIGNQTGQAVSKLGVKGFRASDLFHLLTGVILARGLVLGELLPFGGAYLAALLVFRPGLAGLMVLSTTLGLWSLSLPSNVFWNQVAVLILLASVISSTKRKPEQWWILLPLLVLAGHLLVKNAFLVWNGWNLYQEISIIFEAVMAGVLCLIFMVAVQWMETRHETVMHSEEIMATIILGACLILGISDLHWQHWTLGPIAASLVVLVAAYWGGAGAGSAAGALIGLLPSVTYLVMPYAVGVYAVSGLLAGLFRAWGRLGMSIGFLLGNLLLTLYLSEGSINREILYPLGSGAILFLLLPGRFFSRLGTHVPIYTQGSRGRLFTGFVPLFTSRSDPERLGEDEVEAAEAVAETGDRGRLGVTSKGLAGGEGTDPIWWKLVNERLRNLSRMLNEISATLEKGRIPSVTEGLDPLSGFFEDLKGELCRECSAQRVCWEEDFYVTYRLFLDLLSTGGAADKTSSEPEELMLRIKNRCLYPRDLVQQINQVYEKMKLQQYWQERIEEGRGLVAHQVKGLAGVLNDLVAEAHIQVQRIKTLEKRIIREMKKLGVNLEHLRVYRLPGGELEIYYQRRDCSVKYDCHNRIVPAVTAVLGQQFKINPAGCAGQDKAGCEICLTGAGRLAVEIGIAIRAEDGCACSGDNHLVMDLPGARQLLALSDGMGMGPIAAENSRFALNLMEKILRAGLPTEQAVRALNSLLLLRSSEETFATLDLVIINLQNGESEFFKMGAPPAFVKRKGKVTQISSTSPPVGILDEVEIVGQKEKLEIGDLIVLVTDGVLDSRFHVAEREAWLGQTLQQIESVDPQPVADQLLDRALANSSRVKDDMAVLVARIMEFKSAGWNTGNLIEE